MSSMQQLEVKSQLQSIWFQNYQSLKQSTLEVKTWNPYTKLSYTLGNIPSINTAATALARRPLHAVWDIKAGERVSRKQTI